MRGSGAMKMFSGQSCQVSMMHLKFAFCYENSERLNMTDTLTTFCQTTRMISALMIQLLDSQRCLETSRLFSITDTI
ncbi:unnamed protein product, partial [Dicrocoelium dendriticum]